MADISMCVNDRCEKKDRCYRYKAIPSYSQSYSDFKECKKPDYKSFWDIGNRRDVKS